MADTPGTKMVPVVDPSPMPVLLTNPTPDPTYNGKPTVRVVPGLIRLGSKPHIKQVVWLNQTGGEVTFTFDPNGSAKLFDLSKRPPLTIKDQDTLTLDIAANAPENVLYLYQIDCTVTPGTPAQGDSPPQVSCP